MLHVDLGQDREHLRGQLGSPTLRPALQDSQTGLKLRNTNVHHQSTTKLLEQPVVEVRDFGERAVAGQHQLFFDPLEFRGESQQFGLQFLTVTDELHVVQEHHVGRFEAPAKCSDIPGRHRMMERFHELVQGPVLHRQVRRECSGVVADRHQQMCLAESGLTVDE